METSLEPRDMEFYAIMRCHIQTMIVEIFKISQHCLWYYGTIITWIHFIQVVKKYLTVSFILNIHLTYDQIIPTLGAWQKQNKCPWQRNENIWSQKYIHKKVFSCSIYNIHNLEMLHKLINRRLCKQTDIESQNTCLDKNYKAHITNISSNWFMKQCGSF